MQQNIIYVGLDVDDAQCCSQLKEKTQGKSIESNAGQHFWSRKSYPSPNNQCENDLRMTKVHQKISSCFKPVDGAMIFCRVSSYL